MRLLLTVQRGCKGYECLRTVNGKTYDTFQEVCDAIRVLADDKEFINVITEASKLLSGHQLRRLFVNLMSAASMTNPCDVWNTTWKLLLDDITYNRRRMLKISGNSHLFVAVILNFLGQCKFSYIKMFL